MVEEAAMARAHKPADWYAMSPAGKKQLIENRVEATLGIVEAAGREPDNWERFHLSCALNGAGVGTLGLGWTHACLAALPKAGIARRELVPDLPELAHLSLWALRERLRITRLQPPTLFGEVVA